jgi:LPS-assembly lipoprotein
MKLSSRKSLQTPRLLVMLALAMLLSACGYQLRGDATLPFKSIYIDAANPDSALIKELRNNLKANKIQVSDKAEKAGIILNIALEQSDKQILSLDNTGLVNEYQLRYHVSFRAYDNQQREWLPASEVMLTRDLIYDNSQILAMSSEEAMLYHDMQTDMAQQIMRRLSHARLMEPAKK